MCLIVGSNYYVRILSTIDKELLKPNASVALHKHSNALVDVLPPEADSSIAMLSAEEKPNVAYADIGGTFCLSFELLFHQSLPFEIEPLLLPPSDSLQVLDTSCR